MYAMAFAMADSRTTGVHAAHSRHDGGVVRRCARRRLAHAADRPHDRPRQLVAQTLSLIIAGRSGRRQALDRKEIVDPRKHVPSLLWKEVPR
jgi:hypothetical protein